jgi:hypothetical protein
MLGDKHINISGVLRAAVIFLIALVHTAAHADLTTPSKNDPIPLFTTLNLDDALLLTREQLLYKFDALNGWDYEWADKKKDHVIISISPFAQNADRGKTIRGTVCPIPVPDLTCPEVRDVALGDLTGRTDMIALLYGNTPPGRTAFSSADAAIDFPVLFTASTELFPPNPDGSPNPGLNNEGNIDPAQELGFFSFPLKYRKRGLRFQASGQLPFNLIFQLQAGFANIRQVRENTVNLTTAATFDPVTPTVTNARVNTYLMTQLDAVMDELNMDFCEFIQTSLEDFRFNLYWRDFFPINENAESSWARFLVIPYFEISGAFSPVKIDHNAHRFFSAPFGSNGHSSAGLTAGVNLDFIETIEIGGEIGFTHFFKRNFCNMPVPNSEFQQNLYPYSTNVAIHPGENFYFCARLAAFHFLDRLSMKFQWWVLDHQKDHIKVLEDDPDNTFLPEVLECRSSFKVKLGDVALNYDFSPNFNIGLLWQIPFSQRNAYRSSTIMAGINVTF